MRCKLVLPGVVGLLFGILLSCCSFPFKISSQYVVKSSDTLTYTIKSTSDTYLDIQAQTPAHLLSGFFHCQEYKVPVNQLHPGLNEISLKVSAGKRNRIRKHIVYVVSDVVPRKIKFEVLNQLPHDTSAFTQGIAFYKGWLYESTGLKGKSRLRKIHPKTGACVLESKMDAHFFGEGLVVVNDTLHILTWKDKTHLLYNLDFEELARKYQPMEGWGICHGNDSLWISDGTNTLYRSPVKNIVLGHETRVMNDNGIVTGINELEWVGGMIFANVYGKDQVVVIDPLTGKVMIQVDAAHILDRQAYPEAGILNGIAFDNVSKTFYLTGKNWPFIKVCRLHFGE